MTDIDALVNRLLQHKDEIFKHVKQKSIDDYKYLMEMYKSGNVDNDTFRSKYCHFYALNNARLGDELRREYFELLKKGETSLERVLEKLHKIKIRKGKNTYQLSFATKLLHTKNTSLPIYDKRIEDIPELQLIWRLGTYEMLKQVHAELLKDEHIQSLIKDFKKQYDAESISDAKALDFMLWALGKPTKK